MKKVFFVLFNIFFLFGIFAFINTAYAADFESLINREFSYTANGEYLISETHTISNKSKNRLISTANEEVFQIIILNNDPLELDKIIEKAKLYVDGVETKYKVVKGEKSAEIRVPYPREVTRGQSIEFKLTYLNPGLMNNSGALTDLFVPGFAKDFTFVKGETSVDYQTTLKVNVNSKTLNFVSPDPLETSQDNDYMVYKFKKEDLIGKTVWMQLGTAQYYHFKIIQTAEATDIKNTGYLNEYRLILPRDIEEYKIFQKVYFTSMNPEPIQIVEDKDGNLIGYFKVPSHESTEIVVEGYAEVVSNGNKLTMEGIGLVDEIPEAIVAEYTSEARFWEVNSPEIQTLANELENGASGNVFTIIKNTYDHIVNTIDYSQVKRFGLNERKGALATLNGGAAVCMEYSDLFLTLSRAEKIPARAVFGYGYDPMLTSGSQEAHQWVQVYLPKVDKWASVDVTWGETGNVIIGGDLNHFYTHVTSIEPDSPAMVERVSYGQEKTLVSPDIKIDVLGSIPDQSNLMDEESLLSKYPLKEKSNLLKIVNNLGINSPRAFVSIIFAFLGVALILFSGIQFIAIVRSPIRSK